MSRNTRCVHMLICFECKAPADHAHHVVPLSFGGTSTVPLCERCHGLVHDRDMLDQRKLTSAALQRKRARGEYTGGQPPYGFRRLAPGSRWIVPDEHERATIALVHSLRAAPMSLRDVVRALTERGVLSRKGKPWGLTQIVRLLALGDRSSDRE